LTERLRMASTYWHLAAPDYGSGVAQDCLVVTMSSSLAPSSKPAPVDETGRAMSNLLMPTGLPSACWASARQRRHIRAPTEEEAQSAFPSIAAGSLDGDPVFLPLGPMPDKPGAWIATDKGTRQLQVAHSSCSSLSSAAASELLRLIL
jgi:hypothetical protein